MSTDLAKTSSKEELPAFLQDESLKDVNRSLSGYVKPPRIKIVQGTAKPPISDKFQRGDTILTPTLTLLAPNKQRFQAVPLLFFPEWILRNPIDAEVTIADRSWDPASELAVKSRSPETRKVPWDKDKSKFCRYLEVLHFLLCVVNHDELSGVVAVASFSSAEHKTGTTWATSIKMRGIPMMGTIWDFTVGSRNNNQGSWSGFNIQPPEGDSLVRDEELFNKFVTMHREYKEAHEKSMIVIEDDDATEPTTEF